MEVATFGLFATTSIPMLRAARLGSWELEIGNCEIAADEPLPGYSSPYAAEARVTSRYLSAFILVAVLIPAVADAQERRPTLDLSGGYAGFVDEDTIEHGTVGAAWRWQVTPRFSIGPEVVYMHGPGGDRDIFITAKVLVDFMPEQKVSPYFVADGGMMFHRD